MSTPTEATPAPEATAPEPSGVRLFPTRRAIVVAFVAWWSAFGLIFTGRDLVWTRMQGEDPAAWYMALLAGQIQSYSVAVLALIAYAATRLLPLDRRGWGRIVLPHLGILAVTIVLNAALLWAVAGLLHEWASFARLLVGVFPAWALMYTLLVGVGYAIGFFRHHLEAEARASQLSTQLSRAQLQALKMQLHPHFLFNTLNSVSALMHQDLGAADRMLSRLEDLLRLTLEQAGTHEVRLEEELMILGAYLEIEQTRFGDRLTVEWDVDPDALPAMVPHLILQPLVENAIKHGISPRSAPGRIRVTARLTDDSLEMEVLDNGRGLPAATARRGAAERSGGGVGLANTRARLDQLYPGRHRFAIENTAEGGARVRIVLPVPAPGAALRAA